MPQPERSELRAGRGGPVGSRAGCLRLHPPRAFRSASPGCPRLTTVPRYGPRRGVVGPRFVAGVRRLYVREPRDARRLESRTLDRLMHSSYVGVRRHVLRSRYAVRSV